MKKTLTALAAAVLAVSAASAYSFTYAPTSSFKAQVSVSPKLTSMFEVEGNHYTVYGEKYPMVVRSIERNFKNTFDFSPSVTFSTDINSDLSISTKYNFHGKGSANWEYENKAPYGEKYNPETFVTYKYSPVTKFGYSDGSYTVTLKSKMYGTLKASPKVKPVVGSGKAASLVADFDGVNTKFAHRGFQYHSNDFELQGAKVNFALSYTHDKGVRTYAATSTLSLDDNAFTTGNSLTVNYEKNYQLSEVTATKKNPKETLRKARGNYYDVTYSFSAYGLDTSVWYARAVGFTPSRPEANQVYSKSVGNEVGFSLAYDFGMYGAVDFSHASAFGHDPLSKATYDYKRTLASSNHLGYKTASYKLAPYASVQFKASVDFSKTRTITSGMLGNSYERSSDRGFTFTTEVKF